MSVPFSLQYLSFGPVCTLLCHQPDFFGIALMGAVCQNVPNSSQKIHLEMQTKMIRLTLYRPQLFRNFQLNIDD